MTDRLPPFRADHVGSLLRPADLSMMRREGPSAELTAVEDREIARIVGEQRAVGLRLATDGEFRRSQWHMDFIAELGGVDTKTARIDLPFRDEEGLKPYSHEVILTVDKIHLKHLIFEEATRFLIQEATAQGLTPKVSIPSPSMVTFPAPRQVVLPSAYTDLEEFYEDLAFAYAEEIRGLYDLGLRYLQIDDVSLACMNDPERPVDEDLHVRYISTLNRALQDRPDDLRVAVHLCRGNYRSRWASQGDYSRVADALFNQLDVDGYFLEYDDERSGGFEPLRYLPEGKTAVLGIVTSKRAELEPRDHLLRRIEEASRYAPLDRLAISPQCGFASTEEGNSLSEAEQWAKLALVVETAREVWADA